MPEVTTEPTAARAKSNEVTVYFVMDDQYEGGIAREWVKKHHPGAHVFNKLPLNKLQANITVIPLVRKQDNRSPAEKTQLDNMTGRQHVVKVPLRDLIHEVVECDPIRVKNHWLGSNDGFLGALGGEVNVLTFHDAMAVSVSPLKAEIPDGTPDVMQLVFM